MSYIKLGWPRGTAALAVAASLLFTFGCGGSGNDGTAAPTGTPAPATTAPPATTATPATTAPTAATATALPTTAPAATTPAASPTAAPAATTAAPVTAAPTATTPAAPPTTAPPATTATAAPTTAPPSQEGRRVGEYEGVVFVVSEGSEATFTVTEQLVRLTLPNDAVMRTTALSGAVRLDGGPSAVDIDLHQLASDQQFRDRYVRNRMFPNHPTATFTAPDVGPLPQGLAEGEEVDAQVTGTLDIRGAALPLSFDVQARDDGDKLFVLGRAAFTWDEFGIPTPSAASVASIEDEVRVEVLLWLVPESS